jgi:hypothetical protein
LVRVGSDNTPRQPYQLTKIKAKKSRCAYLKHLPRLWFQL